MNPGFETRVSVLPHFSLCAFNVSRHGITEEGETFELVLKPGMESLYIRRYPIPILSRMEGALSGFLEQEARRFASDGMIPVVHAEPRYSIEPGVVDSLTYQQVVAMVSDSQWRIARLVARLGCPWYFLIHWVGDRTHAELVVCTMTTLEIPER